MEKKNEIGSGIVLDHSVNINERKSIVITGIKKLNSFDDSEFFIDSVMGSMLIKGEKLELTSLDTYAGKISIKGNINSLNYLDDKKMKNESMFSRLFK